VRGGGGGAAGGHSPDRYGRTSVPPPTAVITRESFRLSMMVLTKAMRKKRADMGTNLQQATGGGTHGWWQVNCGWFRGAHAGLR
jgi:hypothetical protein